MTMVDASGEPRVEWPASKTWAAVRPCDGGYFVEHSDGRRGPVRAAALDALQESPEALMVEVARPTIIDSGGIDVEPLLDALRVIDPGSVGQADDVQLGVAGIEPGWLEDTSFASNPQLYEIPLSVDGMPCAVFVPSDPPGLPAVLALDPEENFVTELVLRWAYWNDATGAPVSWGGGLEVGVRGPALLFQPWGDMDTESWIEPLADKDLVARLVELIVERDWWPDVLRALIGFPGRDVDWDQIGDTDCGSSIEWDISPENEAQILEALTRDPEVESAAVALREPDSPAGRAISAVLVAVTEGYASLSDIDYRLRNGGEVDLQHPRSFSRANLQSHNLRDQDLSGLDFSGADLRDAVLVGANLSGADLRKANLRGANLRGSDLTRADLRGADLRSDLAVTDFTGARLDGTKFSGAWADDQTAWPDGFDPDEADLRTGA